MGEEVAVSVESSELPADWPLRAVNAIPGQSRDVSPAPAIEPVSLLRCRDSSDGVVGVLLWLPRIVGKNRRRVSEDRFALSTSRGVISRERDGWFALDFVADDLE